jgi:hypothetical protein
VSCFYAELSHKSSASRIRGKGLKNVSNCRDIFNMCTHKMGIREMVICVVNPEEDADRSFFAQLSDSCDSEELVGFRVEERYQKRVDETQ